MAIQRPVTMICDFIKYDSMLHNNHQYDLRIQEIWQLLQFKVKKLFALEQRTSS